MAVRDFRVSWPRFFAVFLVIAMASAAAGGLRSLIADLTAGIRHGSRELIGGDVALTIPGFPDDAEALEIERAAPGSRRTEVVEILSQAWSDAMPDPVAAYLKAVDPLIYPLCGSITLSPPMSLAEALSRGAVVSPELLESMQVKLGESIRIHKLTVPIVALIHTEPDRFSTAANPFMRIILSRQQMDHAGLLGTGNPYSSRTVFLLEQLASSQEVRDRLAESFPHGNVVEYHDPYPQAMAAFDNAISFLGLAAWAAVVFGALVAAVTVWLHIERRQIDIAVMKAVGGRWWQIVTVYSLQLAMVILIGCIAGLGFGEAVRSTLWQLAQRHLAIAGSGSFHPWVWVSTVAIVLVASFAAAFGSLESTRRVRPQVIFLRMHSFERPLARWSLAVPVISLTLLTVPFTQSPKITGVFLVAMIMTIVILAAFWPLYQWFCVKATGRIKRIPPSVRYGAREIARLGDRGAVLAILMSGGVTLVTSALLCQRAIGQQMISVLPYPSINMLALPLHAEQLAAIRKKLYGYPGVNGDVQFAPARTVRLLKINGEAVDDRRRRVARTWFVSCQDNGRHGIVISEDNARLLGVDRGSRMEFSAKGGPLVGVVEEVRPMNTIEQLLSGITFPCSDFGNAQPFFLAGIPVHPERQSEVRRLIAEIAPTAAIVDRAEVIQMLRRIADRSLTAIQLVAWIMVASAACAVWTIVAATQLDRRSDLAIWRALGASGSVARDFFCSSFVMLGALSGTIGGLLGSILASVELSLLLNTGVVLGDWRVLPLGAISMSLIAGVPAFFASVRRRNVSAIEALREL